MPYVYEGDQPTRVEGKRYANGAVTDDDAVKGKEGFKEVSDSEAKEIRGKRAGNFADTRPDTWEQKFGEKMNWLGQASVAAPLNKVVGDNEAPFGPPTGTITTKQAVMRGASSSAERLAFGDHEWLPEDKEKLEGSTSGEVQAAQAEQSGQLEEVTAEVLDTVEGGGTEGQTEQKAGDGRRGPRKRESSE